MGVGQNHHCWAFTSFFHLFDQELFAAFVESDIHLTEVLQYILGYRTEQDRLLSSQPVQCKTGLFRQGLIHEKQRPVQVGGNGCCLKGSGIVLSHNHSSRRGYPAAAYLLTQVEAVVGHYGRVASPGYIAHRKNLPPKLLQQPASRRGGRLKL